MAKATERVLLVAAESFHGAMPDGSIFLGRKGETIIWSDHPIAKTYPAWFTPLTATHETPGDAEPRIEQATAAPGEKRGA